MSDYGEFIDLVHKRTGINLSLYKEKQMKRRLTSLKVKRECQTFVEYYQLLLRNQEYWNEFLDRITINVSEFYRNRNRWDVLEQTIIPALLARKKKLKIWSAACSTGEEPYTIAMVLSQLTSLHQVEILATDLDEKALEFAKKGIYPSKSLKEIPDSVREQFFTKKDDQYYIDSKLKSVVTFKRHNLLKDRYERGFDLIVCRNVLIYFTDEAKTTIYQNFSQSLREGGVLFVGSTEQIFNPKLYQFQTIETFFYEKIKSRN
ncbi:CheR family methyltransferase [Salinibacillus xinjiangensis]|uniref:protein-glutamate O-methyltransferase n=1 Tax=Salinibacillus xinjiangensis TaxID=1229268 RepID=A0A6G1X5X4_9BACI|nr:protein-glutamate O-methyltransferase CheR [Salinibacillus xinjiangensis]MRG86403.1 chemotaxis protein CheR [Salinibacillus xinjiangensis]